MGGTRSFFKFLWNTVFFLIFVEHGHFSYFGVAFQKVLKFLCNTVIFYILVEHGHFSNFCGTQSFFIFWWKTVIFQNFQGIGRPRKINFGFFFFSWNTDIFQILVEHGRFSKSWWDMVAFQKVGGTWSILKILGGTRSFFKFLWTTVFFHILVEHLHISNFSFSSDF